ncbi:MAG: hypothetical protein JJ891_16865 [Rhizobiaceae bacterium]|jgi:predicted transcriptional regulator|nr:hypothetical protein [Rhizobiaceae bacterium]
MAAIEDIEAKRVQLGISKEKLVRAAQCASKSYDRWLKHGLPLVQPYERRLRQAIAEISGLEKSGPQFCQRIFACYLSVCALVARDLDIDIDVVKRNPPKIRATNNREWMDAAAVREVAAYLLHTSLGFSQQQVANAIGVSKPAVCQLCRKVEDRRDDPEFEQLLARIEGELAI